MKNVMGLMFAFVMLFAMDAFAGVRGYNGTTDLKLFDSIKCSTGLTCSRSAGKMVMVSSPSITGPLSITGGITGDGTGSVSGFIAKRVAATATTITASQCGTTFVNTGAVVIKLPLIATANIGCRLTFIVGNASNFDVNPDDADQILILTNAVGDAIRNATLGSSIVLEALATTQWAVMGKEQGTWTDIN